MINLLPPAIKEARAFGYRNIALTKAVAFLVLAFLFTAALLGYGYLALAATANSVSEIANQKQRELGSIDAIQKQAQDLADTIATASTLLNRETKFSELLKQVGALMPPGASLNGLRLTGDKTQPLEITVNLTSIDQASVLQKNLTTSDLFQSADILSVDRKQETDAAGTIISQKPQATLQVVFKQTTAETKAQKAKNKLPENFKP